MLKILFIYLKSYLYNLVYPSWLSMSTAWHFNSDSEHVFGGFWMNFCINKLPYYFQLLWMSTKTIWILWVSMALDRLPVPGIYVAFLTCYCHGNRLVWIDIPLTHRCRSGVPVWQGVDWVGQFLCQLLSRSAQHWEETLPAATENCECCHLVGAICINTANFGVSLGASPSRLSCSISSFCGHLVHVMSVDDMYLTSSARWFIWSRRWVTKGDTVVETTQ